MRHGLRLIFPSVNDQVIPQVWSVVDSLVGGRGRRGDDHDQVVCGVGSWLRSSGSSCWWSETGLERQTPVTRRHRTVTWRCCRIWLYGIKHAAFGGANVAKLCQSLTCPQVRLRLLRAAWRPCSRGPALRAVMVVKAPGRWRLMGTRTFAASRSGGLVHAFPRSLIVHATPGFGHGRAARPATRWPSTAPLRRDRRPGQETGREAVHVSHRDRIQSSSWRAAVCSPSARRSKAKLLAEVRVSGWSSPSSCCRSVNARSNRGRAGLGSPRVCR
jgi:hypothetical protein